METTYKCMPDVCGFKHHPGTPDPKGCINKLNSWGPFPAIDTHWCLFTSQASREQSCLAQRSLEPTMWILGLFLQYNCFACSTVTGSWRVFKKQAKLGFVMPKEEFFLFRPAKLRLTLSAEELLPNQSLLVNVTSIKTWLFHKQLRTKQAAPEKAEGFWLLAEPSDFQGFNKSDTQLEAKYSCDSLFFLIIWKAFLEGEWPISLWGETPQKALGVSTGLDLLLGEAGN